MKNILLWHEHSNYLAIAWIERGGLPLLTILDDEYTGINPFYSYPMIFLEGIGWSVIGEL